MATVAATVATAPTWPPPSLETNAEAIVNECEVAEMTPPMDERPMSAAVHMAALIYLGETVHARHLWRRTPLAQRKDQVFLDWWEVAKAMLQSTDAGPALQKCAEQHPEPLKTYAAQIVARPGGIGKKAPQQQVLNEDVVSFLETKKWNA